MAAKAENLEWRRDNYKISTDPKLLSVSAVNAAFDMDMIYWTKSLPEDEMQNLLESSVSFGVYEVSAGTDEHQQIGLGRAVTDHSSFVYLTDVYILPSHQSKGLGRWLISCMKEWIHTLSHLRMAMLFTGTETGKRFYSQNLDMKEVGGIFKIMGWKGPGDVIDW